ncbi:glycoside hydrolase family 16 protein [Arenibacter aquaticus]|uniref:Glycoside hydrolase family 16 protein n=1 Tax=Arenibacter aquaticus TaxID=2489054 RepID=A0A430K1I1_9FLAO|nr:glycoside hydrolase family 16 protein [Arenibacter aquaticus]RTE52789.1 glycoside hydrolase family 16 protein [Arenibacter aquaticus]
MMHWIIGLLIITSISCGGNNEADTFSYTDMDKEMVLPSDLSVSVEVMGSDEDNPNGFGTGEVQIIATASDAVTYGLVVDGGTNEIIAADGKFSYIFKEEGSHDHNLRVMAYSGTGHSIELTKTVRVFVDSYEAQLVWSDEFDVEGAVSKENWKLETFAPNNGSWWNGELQHYTNRLDNAYVSEGTLKIVAKKEEFTTQGTTKEYTSARLNSLFSFTYGRVEVRAKLPKGHGTWPAIWMLGSNIETVGWPACGEIDIMEHWGHEAGKISSATHTPSCSGGCPDTSVGTTIIADYDTEFHVYAVEWTKEALNFIIDGEHVYTYNPAIKNSDTWPFTRDQFLILNVAMGGDWFGVDPNFKTSSMEVDYVRVYQ